MHLLFLLVMCVLTLLDGSTNLIRDIDWFSMHFKVPNIDWFSKTMYFNVPTFESLIRGYVVLLLPRSPHSDVHTSLLDKGSSFPEILWAAVELCLRCSIIVIFSEVLQTVYFLTLHFEECLSSSLHFVTGSYQICNPHAAF